MWARSKGTNEQGAHDGNHITFTGDATTSAPQEGATMTTAPRVDEIEDLKVLMANFNGYGHISHDYLKVDGQWKITTPRSPRSM